MGDAITCYAISADLENGKLNIEPFGSSDSDMVGGWYRSEDIQSLQQQLRDCQEENKELAQAGIVWSAYVKELIDADKSVREEILHFIDLTGYDTPALREALLRQEQALQPLQSKPNGGEDDG